MTHNAGRYFVFDLPCTSPATTCAPCRCKNAARCCEQGNAPWHAYEASRQALVHAMKQLGIEAPSHA